MLKKLLASALAIAALVCAATSFAADINKATDAELDAVRGIGPAMTSRILDERKKGAFKDWNDLIDRVKGIGPNNAARFSKDGLTVNGEAYKAASASVADKPAKADKKADTAKK